MEPLKILITGSTGQVGYELVRDLAVFGEILAPTRAQLDLADEKAVDAYLEEHKPSLIVNPAAWTSVDNAEQEVQAAKRLNAELPKQLARYASENDAWLIHYSTDYVYPGDGDTPWVENDTPGPLSVYGETKLKGDVAVQQHCDKHLIFRTSWVYSYRGNNFLKTMLRLGQERKELKIVDDQVGVPTPAILISHVTMLFIYRLINSLNFEPGIYHLSPRGETTWYSFAKEIFSEAKLQGFELMIQDVRGISTSQYPTEATRPLNSRLSTKKLERTMGFMIPDWQTFLPLTIKNIKQ
ncbi:dTDP-4-dehydrorhamnose reductase [Lacimicrobium sp. SS2-24]|uniref:dTDP-4-dehydrorhamnose reductase n=1 Tax=Lacimicrobium sp. SS2-24 TaxID=2005569 RepID=UPI000B4A82E0|nr:dTDP-4-dehydrorhamnose reductase [Lacimicrobium sp. SS2-24]